MKIEEIIPQQWAPPCNSRCTQKYAALMQIPWRVFCKKGCDADGETWDECLGECDETCYKDPVLKDKKWSSYIDRSPGSVSYSEECFRACVSGCGYKFDIPKETVEEVHARPPPPKEEKPTPTPQNVEDEKPLSAQPKDEVPNTSA